MTTAATQNNDWLVELFAQAANNSPETVTAPVVTATAPITAKKAVCQRCGGHGQLPSFRHVSGGVCFACNGSGNARK